MRRDVSGWETRLSDETIEGFTASGEWSGVTLAYAARSVAFGEVLAVACAQRLDDLGGACPKRRGIDAGTGLDALFDQLARNCGDLEAGPIGVCVVSRVWSSADSNSYGGYAALGHLCILVGLDARYADGADAVSVDRDRDAAFQQPSADVGDGKKCRAAAIDHLLIAFGFTAADGGAASLFHGNVGANWSASIHAAQGQRMTALIDDGNSDVPAVTCRLLLSGANDAIYVGTGKYGAGKHVMFLEGLV
jgi:hypothetical protein